MRIYSLKEIKNVLTKINLVQEIEDGFAAYSKGEVVAKTNWDEVACLNHKININDGITFYKRFGDFIGRIFMFLSFILIIVTFVKAKVKN